MGQDLLPDYRRPGRAENRWLQDRDGIAAGKTYTGLYGTTMQDIAVQESMGPIQDREIEHLGMTDRAVVHMRRMLLAMARAQRDGKELEIPALTSDYGHIRSAAAVMGSDDDWWMKLYGTAATPSGEKVL
jgi:phthalate 4,5-dioxygenase oxygenase subunit